jgi:hypothetical protein
MLQFSKQYRKDLQAVIIEDRQRDSRCAILVGAASHTDLACSTRKPSSEIHQLAPADPAVRGCPVLKAPSR